MRVLSILIVFIYITSCQKLQDKRHNRFVSKVETIGIDKFKNIEYGTRGEFELYNYCVTNDSSILWTYNPKIEQFEFTHMNQDANILSRDYKVNIVDLRKEIQSLNIVMLTQSPWCGNIIRFWISEEEMIVYVNPEFKFDNKFKNEWLKEIETGRILKVNWYYVKTEKK